MEKYTVLKILKISPKNIEVDGIFTAQKWLYIPGYIP